MKAHAAFYRYVEEKAKDTKYGRQAAAHARAWNPGDEDSQWLYDHAGTKYRSLWKNLPAEEKKRRMEATEDPTFDGPPSGIKDARSDKRKKTDTSPASTSARSRDKPGPTVVAKPAAPPTPVTPEIVKRMESTRLSYVRAQQNVAITNAQLSFMHNDKVLLLNSIIGFWRNLGAQIAFGLPPTLAQQVAAQVADGVDMLETVSGAELLHSSADLMRHSVEVVSGVKRIGAIYARQADEAVSECERLGLPDPDPRLPRDLVQRPRVSVVLEPEDEAPVVAEVGMQAAPRSTKKNLKRAVVAPEHLPGKKKAKPVADVRRSAATGSNIGARVRERRRGAATKAMEAITESRLRSRVALANESDSSSGCEEVNEEQQIDGNDSSEIDPVEDEEIYQADMVALQERWEAAGARA